MLSLVGEFEPQKVKVLIEKLFVTSGGLLQPTPNFPTQPQEKLNIHAEEVEQDKISLLWPRPGFLDIPFIDRQKFRLGSYILGGSSRSLLNTRLREQLHLVYATGFSPSTRPHAGVFEAWAATTPESTQRAVDELRQTIYKFLEKPIDNQLFQRSLNFIKSNISLSFDSLHSVSGSITYDLYWEDRIYLPEEEIELIDQITESQVRDILKTYLTPKNEYLAIMTKNKNLKVGWGSGQKLSPKTP